MAKINQVQKKEIKNNKRKVAPLPSVLQIAFFICNVASPTLATALPILDCSPPLKKQLVLEVTHSYKKVLNQEKNQGEKSREKSISSVPLNNSEFTILISSPSYVLNVLFHFSKFIILVSMRKKAKARY
ncbi:hypothetical protein PIB30_095277 [Stylosanthes scabra]|uniref:Transmembrane protein n=1 Tax=Stylosanthes scabra TaxID=79078 RepID=A0ABU6YUH6_9FABA|nr:hypothetical protein [Stylosanthes scabra]